MREHLPDIIFFILIITVFNIFFPYNLTSVPNLKKGDIAPKDVIAPYSFQLLKNDDVLKRERQAAYDNIPPVIIYDSQKTMRILNDFDIMTKFADSLSRSPQKPADRKALFLKKYPEFTPEMADILFSEKGGMLVENSRKLMKDVLDKGILPDKTAVPYGKDRKIVVIRNETESVMNETEILDNAEAMNRIKEKIVKSFSSSSFFLKYGIEMIQHFLRPNLMIDLDETSARREKARNEVPVEAGMVLKGEIIVRAHDIVDLASENKLSSLSVHSSKQTGTLTKITRFLVKNLIFFTILLLYAIFINSNFPMLKFKLKDKFLIYLLLAVNISIYGIFYQFGFIEYLMPLLITVMIFSLLYSRTFAYISLIFIISSLLIYSGMRLQGLLAVTVTGIYAIYMIRSIEKRSQFASVILRTSVIIAIFAFGIEIYRESSISNITLSILAGVFNASVSVLLLILFLPFFEKMLDRITNITLLDLSDLNNKLLRNLAENTAGTFHHSLTVGNLAENAAKAIGADDLMARVGAYYHDVGKIEKPEYFIENQSANRNPHESLPPELSAEIIREHVKNGVKIGMKYKLPEQIIDFIRTHHGTSRIDYFYEKAKEKNENVEQSRFIYPGPIPVSKETTIVMLADSIEAAVRSLKNVDGDNIEIMVNKIITKRYNEMQLEQSDLSLKEINRIREVFISVLQSIYHPRIDYDDKKKK